MNFGRHSASSGNSIMIGSISVSATANGVTPRNIVPI